MSRVNELQDVDPERRDYWLAGQLDEVETGLFRRLDALTLEMASLRKVLVAILVAIIVALVSLPVGVIWQAAVR